MERSLTDEILSDVADNSRESPLLFDRESERQKTGFAENSRESRQTHSLILDSESERQKCVDFLVNLLTEGKSDATEDRQSSHTKIGECFAQQKKEISRLTRRIESLEATNKEYLDLLTKREDHMTNCMEKTSTLCHKIVMLLSENVAAEAQKYSSDEVERVASSRKRKAVSLE